MEMKSVLITGGSGYIGSHLTKLLHEQGYEVYVVDVNEPQYTGTTGLLPVYRNLDVRNNLTPYFEKVDCIVHLAALIQVGESSINPSIYYSTNIIGTMKTMRIPHDNFILASTGCAPQCASPYAMSKLAAEQVVEELEEKDYTIFRFYNVIGTSGFESRNPDGLMSQLIKAKETGQFTIYGTDYSTRDGTAIRDYVHVDEICQAILQAIEEPANKVENLGHGTGYTVREIVDQFKLSNNCSFEVLSGPRRAGDLESSVLDNPSQYMKKLYEIDRLLALQE